MKRIVASLVAWAAFGMPALAARLPAGETVTPPPIAARAYILVDMLSGATLAAANDDDRFEPASLTKLMTAYVAFQALREHRLDPAQEVKVSQRALKAGGARMFLDPREPVTVKQLLQGLLVPSGNDAAVALAEAVAGTEERFAAQMNEQAARLGLADTHFVNASGAPSAEQRSSARDIATLTLAILRDFPDRYALFGQKEFTYNGVAQANRNRLLWTDPTVDGVASGFTEAAGYCLVASARRGERRLVSVVLGAQSDTLRTSESQKLMNFGFQAYDTRRIYRKAEPLARPAIYKGTASTVAIGFDHDVWLTLPRDRFDGLKATLDTRKTLVAPIAAGEKAGIMSLTRNAAPIAQFPVVALEEVPVAGFLSRGWDTLKLQFHRSP
jgi:serine-type D-Ala-D-Ala carboxypeptidase (penicillin-binding protein 5/6)